MEWLGVTVNILELLEELSWDVEFNSVITSSDSLDVPFNKVILGNLLDIVKIDNYEQCNGGEQTAYKESLELTGMHILIFNLAGSLNKDLGSLSKTFLFLLSCDGTETFSVLVWI